VEALAEAYRSTRSPGYARLALRAFDWFHGANRLVQPVFDRVTGVAGAALRDAPVPAPSVTGTLAYLAAELALAAAGVAAVPAANAPIATPLGGITSVA
jgi:hypothetical protein